MNEKHMLLHKKVKSCTKRLFSFSRLTNIRKYLKGIQPFS